MTFKMKCQLENTQTKAVQRTQPTIVEFFSTSKILKPLKCI